MNVLYYGPKEKYLKNAKNASTLHKKVLFYCFIYIMGFEYLLYLKSTL